MLIWGDSLVSSVPVSPISSLVFLPDINLTFFCLIDKKVSQNILHTFYILHTGNTVAPR